MENSFFDSGIFSYGLLPLLIFISRICDVSLGTMRIIFVSKGRKNIAPILGFFEVLIWITIVSRIMQNMDNYFNYIAYAAGFATGNFAGMIIEEKLAMGIQMIRVFTYQNGDELVKSLNSNGFGATSVEAHGARENVLLVYTIVQRNNLGRVIELIMEHNPKAFYTIEDVRTAREGIFPPKKTSALSPFGGIIRQWRKGK